MARGSIKGNRKTEQIRGVEGSRGTEQIRGLQSELAILPNF